MQAPGWTDIHVPVGPMTDVKVERPGEEKVPLAFGPPVQDGWSTPSRSYRRQRPSSAAIWTFNTVPRAEASLEKVMASGMTNGFDQQRFVPFIYADITEHVKFASEIEIEHGIREDGRQRNQLGICSYRLSRQ